MDDLEMLNHAEMKLDEAVRGGNAYEREFWRGYIHGLKRKIAAARNVTASKEDAE